MGDRCYMKVICRRQDRERFEKLDFCLEYEESPTSPVIEMLDQEANYAHEDQMPTDIPYRGYHDAGGEYGAEAFACDGKEHASVEIGHWGGFVVDWNEADETPSSKSLHEIRHYVRIRKAVDELFKSSAPSKPSTGKEPDV